MSKEMITTICGVIAVIAAVFMVGWAIRGAVVDAVREEVAPLRNEVSELRGDIAANTASIAELRGALLSHIGGHHHAPVVAEAPENSEAETR